jgi:hypothetical protein
MQFGIVRREYNFEVLGCALRQSFIAALPIKPQLRGHPLPFPHFP